MCAFLQHMADNIDHNLRTLDGYNTFHGMGIIAVITPKAKNIPKVKVTAEDVIAEDKINTSFLKPKEGALPSLRYDKLLDFTAEDKTENADLLWKTYCLLRPERHSWNGYMQMAGQGSHQRVTFVFFMPMFDLNSSDEICIYSTMCFVSEKAKRYNYTYVLTVVEINANTNT